MKNKFNFLGIVLFTVLINTVLMSNSEATSVSTSLVRLQLTNYPKQMKQIHAQALDLAGVDLHQKQVDLIVNSEQAKWLMAHSFKIIYTSTLDNKMSPDSRYQNPTKIESALKQLAAVYPTLAQVKSIGKSLVTSSAISSAT